MLTRSTILSLLAGLAAAAPSVVIEASATVAQPQQQHGGLEAEAGRLILVGGYSRFTEVLRFNPFVEPATLERVSSSDGGDSEDKAWLIRHPTSPRILLSVNDNGAPGAAGYVASFLLSPSSGAISFVDHKITQASDSSESGVDPAHAAFFPDGKTVGVANYKGQKASTFQFDPLTARFGQQINNGSLLDFSAYTPVAGQDPIRQSTSHPHMILPHPYLPILYIPDLGADLLRRFRIGKGGILSPMESYPQPLGSGPRHAAIGSDGRWMFLLHEISVEMSVYEIETGTERGDLSLVQDHVPIYDQNATLSVNISAAEVHVSNDGRFLYASTRNLTSPAFIPPGDAADILAVWSINSTTGHLTRQQSAMAFGGRGLRAMELSPALTGSSGGGEDYVVTGGQTTNTTQVFKRDRTDGTLELVASCGNRFSPSTYIWV